MTMTLAPAGTLETTVLDESLLDREVPCSWDQPTPCQDGAEWVRVCPRCKRHRFRCNHHYKHDLARPASHEYRCDCGHTAPARELNASYRPV